MRSALLRGRESVELGVVRAMAEPGLAIALSRGGAPKRYPHSDPNEDAVGFAWASEGACIAAADGHGGAEAAEIAILHVLGEPAAQWTEAPGPLDAASWPRQARAVLSDADRDVVRERSRPEARTTLGLVLTLPARGLLLAAAIGDSHLFLADGTGVREVAPVQDEVGFLGDGRVGSPALDAASRFHVEPLAGLRAAVLVTDGLSERGIGVASPLAAVSESVRLAEAERPAVRALVLARSLAEAALEAHRRNRAGDNVAVAALWLSE